MATAHMEFHGAVRQAATDAFHCNISVDVNSGESIEITVTEKSERELHVRISVDDTSNEGGMQSELHPKHAAAGVEQNYSRPGFWTVLRGYFERIKYLCQAIKEIMQTKEDFLSFLKKLTKLIGFLIGFGN